MRVVGLDLGTRRIGVAVSDASGTLASPYEVIHRSGDVGRDHREVARIVDELEAERVVGGMPLSLSGKVGPAAAAAAEEVETLAQALTVPVEPYDERLTTVTAAQQLRAAGLDARRQRDKIDKVAAAVMLQAWLDGQPG